RVTRPKIQASAQLVKKINTTRYATDFLGIQWASGVSAEDFIRRTRKEVAEFAWLRKPSTKPRERARRNSDAEEKDRAGARLPNDQVLRSLCGERDHTAGRRRPTLPCERRDESWPGWRQRRWKHCEHRL